MSELNRIKQAMADAEHTDGDLQWCVDRIEELEEALGEAIGYLTPHGGMATTRKLLGVLYNESIDFF